MQFEGNQYRKITYIDYHDSFVVKVVRYALYGISFVGAVVVFRFCFPAINISALTIGLLMTIPFFFVLPYSLYIAYLKDNPKYLANTKYRLDKFDYDSVRILKHFANSTNHQIFWENVFKDGSCADVLLRLGLNISTDTRLANYQIGPEDADMIVAELEKTVAEGDLINKYTLIGYIISQSIYKDILNEHNITPDFLKLVFDWRTQRDLSFESYEDRFDMKSFYRTGGIGKNWASGYTTFLDNVTKELGSVLYRRNLVNPLYSREKYVDELISELNQTQGQNILIVGDGGSGKKELFYHLSEDILTFKTKTTLDGYNIRVLNIERLLAGIGGPNNIESVMDRLFSDLLHGGKIILFIPRIEILLDPHEKAGTANLANVLESYLANRSIKIVATTDNENYAKIIQPDNMLKEHFSVFKLPSLSGDDLLKVLFDRMSQFEHRYKMFFRYSTVKKVAELASRFIKDDFSPMKELRLLEEIASYVHASGRDLATDEDAGEVIEKQTGVTVQVDKQQATTLASLYENLRARVIGQDGAIKSVSDAMIRAGAGIAKSGKPLATFLMLGPTGVGKTETAKSLADIYYGSQAKMIRLDMAEYSDDKAVAKMLGTDPVDYPGALTVALRQNPSAVILFDEFEKANPNVITLLLSVLDEGRLTNNYGRVLDFTNTIIIATSNAGSDLIKSSIETGSTTSGLKKGLVDHLIVSKIFAPELLNRFDEVIVYSPLKSEDMVRIATLRLNELSKAVKKDKGITVVFTDEVISTVAQVGYDPVFGARALDRAIKTMIETQLAKTILETNPKMGDTVTINSVEASPLQQ